MKFFFNIPFFKIKNIIFLLVFSLSVFSSYGVNKKEISSNSFDKKGIFKATLKEYGEVVVEIPDSKSIKINSVKSTSKEIKAGGGNRSYTYNLHTLDYGGILISFKEYNSSNKIEEKIEKLQAYLFPKNTTTVVANYKSVISSILSQKEFTDSDVQKIKGIANCGAKYFSVEDR